MCLRRAIPHKPATAATSSGQAPPPPTESLALALELTKHGWCDVDWSSQKAIWSPQYEVIWGYKPGQPERDSADWECRVHPDDLEHIHQATQYACDHHEDLAIQYRILWPDGTECKE